MQTNSLPSDQKEDCLQDVSLELVLDRIEQLEFSFSESSHQIQVAIDRVEKLVGEWSKSVENSYETDLIGLQRKIFERDRLLLLQEYRKGTGIQGQDIQVTNEEGNSAKMATDQTNPDDFPPEEFGPHACEEDQIQQETAQQFDHDPDESLKFDAPNPTNASNTHEPAQLPSDDLSQISSRTEISETENSKQSVQEEKLDIILQKINEIGDFSSKDSGKEQISIKNEIEKLTEAVESLRSRPDPVLDLNAQRSMIYRFEAMQNERFQHLDTAITEVKETASVLMASFSKIEKLSSDEFPKAVAEVIKEHLKDISVDSVEVSNGIDCVGNSTAPQQDQLEGDLHGRIEKLHADFFRDFRVVMGEVLSRIQ